MERPRSHVVNTISNKAFESMIPDQWVARELSNDYGLDYIVEIFEEGQSTGKLFFVQLKGTDRASKNGKISYSLSASHFDYYNSIPVPILFLIYSTKENRFWAQWTNNLYSTLGLGKKDQKTFGLKFNSNHIVDNSFFKKLPEVFANDIFTRQNIRSITPDKVSERYHQELIAWLQEYFPNSIIEDHNQVTTITLDYSLHNENYLNICIDSPNNFRKIDQIHLSDSFFITPPVNDFEVPNAYLIEPLVYISFLLSKVNTRGSLRLLTKCIDWHEGEIHNENLLALGTLSIDESYLDDLQALIKKLIKKEKYNAFQILNMIILGNADTDKHHKVYQENLLETIDNIDEEFFKGMLHYNLANSYRGQSKYYEASQHYQLARKLQPGYLERTYWWHEYAGVLFLTGHYIASERFYNEAIDLGAEIQMGMIVNALLADSQFLQGKFRKAKTSYEKYLFEEEKPAPLYSLKRTVCDFLLHNNLNGVKFDYTKSKELTKQGIKEMNTDKLDKAIEHYPLNTVAWFNYGICQLKIENNINMAFMAFLTCACFDESDKESWINALLIVNDAELIYVLYKVVVEKFGIKIINDIAYRIHAIPQIGKKQKSQIIDGMYEIVKEISESEEE